MSENCWRCRAKLKARTSHNSKYLRAKTPQPDNSLIFVSSEQLEVATEFLATGDEVLVSITVVELIARGAKEAVGDFLRSYLSSDNEKIRTRVMAFYIFRYDEEQLKDLLAQYTSGATYCYDVACCFDRMLYAPARLKSVYRGLVESNFLGLVIPDRDRITGSEELTST